MNLQYIKLNSNIYIQLFKAKDFGKLTKKIITDKNGHQKTVYVKTFDDLFKQREKGIKKYIESIRNETIEHSICLDAKGDILVHKIGEKNNIFYTQRELSKMNGAKLHIHNHPNGVGFSNSDLIFATVNNIKEIKMVTINIFNKNESLDYSLKIIHNIKTKEEIQLIKKEYNIIFNEMYKKVQNKVYNGELGQEEIERDFFHWIMRKFVNNHKGWFIYDRQIRTSKIN